MSAPSRFHKGLAARVRGYVAEVRRRSRRLLLRALGALVVAQVVTIGVIMLVGRWRKRRKPPGGFPRMDFDEVEVDGNRIQLYGSGQRLFDDMLRAIDEARHSILLETYIWKGDKLGQ